MKFHLSPDPLNWCCLSYVDLPAPAPSLKTHHRTPGRLISTDVVMCHPVIRLKKSFADSATDHVAICSKFVVWYRTVTTDPAIFVHFHRVASQPRDGPLTIFHRNPPSPAVARRPMSASLAFRRFWVLAPGHLKLTSWHRLELNVAFHHSYQRGAFPVGEIAILWAASPWLVSLSARKAGRNLF